MPKDGSLTLARRMQTRHAAEQGLCQPWSSLASFALHESLAQIRLDFICPCAEISISDDCFDNE